MSSELPMTKHPKHGPLRRSVVGKKGPLGRPSGCLDSPPRPLILRCMPGFGLHMLPLSSSKFKLQNPAGRLHSRSKETGPRQVAMNLGDNKETDTIRFTKEPCTCP